MDASKYDFFDVDKYDFFMEIFPDKNDKIRWRLVTEEKLTKKRDIESSGQRTFKTVDEAEAHCCFLFGDRWKVTVITKEND